MRFLTFCGISLALGYAWAQFLVNPFWVVIVGFAVLIAARLIQRSPVSWGLFAQVVYSLTMGFGALLAAPALYLIPMIAILAVTDPTNRQIIAFLATLVLVKVGWETYRWADDHRRGISPDPLAPPSEGSAPPPPSALNSGGSS
jgi:predicted cobalt transporter CbtA